MDTDLRQGRHRTFFILPTALSTWGPQSHLFFFPTYFMEPHCSAQVSKRPQAGSCWPSACLSPPSVQFLRNLLSNDTLHILWCRTINLATLFLFSTLHFPTASLFAEALKRWLAFRWQNIEKVRAVPHNAAIHRAHQLLKHHSHKSNTSTVCSGRLWKLCAWRSSRSHWTRLGWISP